MPLFREYKEDDFRLGVWKVEETVEQLWASLHCRSFYEETLAKFISDSRKQEWLAIRVLLKALCGEEKEIAYCPSGKPYLKDGSGFISISHTRGYVAVALHPSVEVGVDIEKYGEKVKRVASRFIRPDEEVSISRGDEIYGLLLHWSAKETMFKLMGEEGVDFLQHLHILPFTPSAEGVIRACEYRTSDNHQYLIHYMTHPDFVLTWSKA